MLRTVFLVIHVSAGVIGLVLGLLAFRLRAGRPDSVRLGYAAALGVLSASLVGMLVIDWPELATGAQLGFAALAALSVVMIYRIVRAFGEAASATPGWQERYVGHVFFTYIALWIGFVAVLALRLPFPQIAVPVVAIGTLLIGQALVRVYHRRAGTGHRATPGRRTL
jgi:hypothetical protein